MSKRKRYRRELNQIGKSKYDFIVNDEKNYYCYLSCLPMDKKERDRLENEYRFDSYKSWKAYVRDKYKEYDTDKLIEFSRYLNQRIRGVESNYAYWNTFIPIILTLLLTEMFEISINIKFDSADYPSWFKVVAYIICLIVLGVPIGIMIKNTLEPVRDNNIEEYLYKDYKEIIDEMIIDRGEK